MPEANSMLGFVNDCLKIFNFKRAQELLSMTDDQLWNFVDKNRHVVNRFFKGNHYPQTEALYGYLHGEERFREFFFQELEESRDYVVHMLILDFCLSDQQIILGYWGKSGYLDDADSCSPITSDSFIPEYDKENYWINRNSYFQLMESRQIDNIIASLKNNIDNLQINTPADISRLTKIRNFCLKHEEFKVVYIYDL